jgi:hypothetical protein
MTAHTAFAQRFVLKHKWATLRRMTLVTGRILAQETGPAAFQCLQTTGTTALDRVALVWIMTIGTTDFAFQDRMVMRQLEGRTNLRVALETGIGRFFRVNNRARAPTALNVQTPRSMTRFTSHVLGVVAGRF